MPGRTQEALYERSGTCWGQFRLAEDKGHGRNGRQVWKGLLSGLAAGLAGCWVMTQYQVNSQKLIRKAQPTSVHDESQPKPENPTIMVAQSLTRRIAGTSVPENKKEIAGNLVHYGFGTLMGGLCGALVEMWPHFRARRGLVYGVALWAAVDEITLPALGLAKWAPEYPIYVHANALGAHLVYAFSVDSAYRLIRPLVDKIEISQQHMRELLGASRLSRIWPVIAALMADEKEAIRERTTSSTRAA